MDQEKVSAIIEWPTPKTAKDLQRFLSFANFYRSFLRGFSSITTLLTSLFKKRPKCLSWNTTANEDFERLKKAFTTVPF